MLKTLRLHWLGWLLLVAWLLGGCGTQGTTSGRGTFPWAYALAGPVATSQVLLALVVDHDRTLLAYATDGQNLAEWFRGSFQGQALDLTTAAGSRLQVTLSAQGAQGMLTLAGGSPLAFQITPATEPAGLYTSKEGMNAASYEAAWVLLADGRQAGVLENGSLRQAAPQLDPAHPTISLPNGVTLIAGIVVPPSSLDD